MDAIEELGWDPGWKAVWDAHAPEGTEPARVVRIDRECSRVVARSGEWSAQLPKKMRRDVRTRPAVGDWVAIEPLPGDEDVLIRAVLPRRSRFSRKVAGKASEEQMVAANIDTVFLVSGLDQDFNPRRIERYVTLAWDSGAQPVVVLNKADLDPDPDARVAEVEALAPGVPVVAISAREDTGIDRLRAHFASGQDGVPTVALLGSSGVGKSTLVNRLVGEDRMRTAEVRAGDDRGRHTTTHREVVRLPDGTLLIDNPGMRELQLWATEEAVDETFTDVEAFAARCRFADCKHHQEPDCAVRAAVEQGALSAERWEAYRKLQAELRALGLRRSEHARRSHERRTMGRWRKEMQKRKRER